MAPSQDQATRDNATVESMTKHIVNELTVGSVEDPEIKCGFIGEVGCCTPLFGMNMLCEVECH